MNMISLRGGGSYAPFYPPYPKITHKGQDKKGHKVPKIRKNLDKGGQKGTKRD